MKKIIWLIAICILFICIIYLVHLYKRAKIISNFKDVYISEKEFDTFCENVNIYQLEVDIENSSLSLFLERDNNNIWNGSLSHFNKIKRIEKIPVYIEDDALIIDMEENKKIPLSKILLYKNFDSNQYSIRRAVTDSIDFPLEEVKGDYSLDLIKPYMKTLYDELFSNLNSFDRKEEYFTAIDKLESVVSISNLTDKNHIGHLLSFGFTGNSNIKFNAGYGGLENISLLLFERIQPDY